MAGAPITWQNIHAPAALDVGRTMDSAARLILGAINQAGTGIKDYDQGQMEVQKQEFMDRITAAKTPQEIEALRSSGQLDTALASLDPRVRGQVRDADTARLASLQQQAQTAQAFKDFELKNQQKPVRDQIVAAMIKGDQATVDSLFKANPTLVGASELQLQGETLRQSKKKLDLQEKLINAKAAHLTQGKLPTSTDLREAHKAVLKDTLYAKGHLGDEGAEEVRKHMKDNKFSSSDKNTVGRVMSRFRNGVELIDASGNKVTYPVPAMLVTSLLSDANNGSFFGIGGGIDEEKLVKGVEAAMTDPVTIRDHLQVGQAALNGLAKDAIVTSGSRKESPVAARPLNLKDPVKVANPFTRLPNKQIALPFPSNIPEEELTRTDLSPHQFIW